MVNFMLCVFYHSCAQLSLILCDPMDCSPPGSSVNGILQVENTDMGCHAFSQGIFQAQGTCISWSPANADRFFTAT